MEHKTYIICSAINYKGHIIAGRRHSDAFQTLEAFLDPKIYKSIERALGAFLELIERDKNDDNGE